MSYNNRSLEDERIKIETANENKAKNKILLQSQWTKALKQKKTAQHLDNANEPSTSNASSNPELKIVSYKLSKRESAADCDKKSDDEIQILQLRNKKTETKKRKVDEDDEIIIVEQKRAKDENGEELMRAELLRRMAIQKLKSEAKRSAQRAEEHGPQGWLKPRSLATNKIFLARTLRSLELDRREREERQRQANSRGKKRNDESTKNLRHHNLYNRDRR